MVRVEIGKRAVGTNDTSGAGRIRRVADALAIDNAYEGYVARANGGGQACELDLSAINYLDHDALLYLGALVSRRQDEGHATTLELPTAGSAWNFMHAWKFPSFIQNITGKPFEDSLCERSRDLYSKTLATYPKYVAIVRTPRGGTEELLPSTHFQITPIRLESDIFKAASIVKDSWMERHIVTVLDSYLSGDGRRVGSVVVLEAVLNAAMHPHAKVAYTSSQIVRPSGRSGDDPPRLEIAIWDDGIAIADTLQRRLSAGLSITSTAFGEVDETFEVRLSSRQFDRHERSEDSTVVQSGGREIRGGWPWLIVAAFMAGVTSLPDRSNLQTGDALRRQVNMDDPLTDHRGLGLYYLRKHVINLWGGRIRYYSGNYRLNMIAGRDSTTYAVNIQHRPQTSWDLKGNLMIMEIPLTTGGL